MYFRRFVSTSCPFSLILIRICTLPPALQTCNTSSEVNATTRHIHFLDHATNHRQSKRFNLQALSKLQNANHPHQKLFDSGRNSASHRCRSQNRTNRRSRLHSLGGTALSPAGALLHGGAALALLGLVVDQELVQGAAGGHHGQHGDLLVGDDLEQGGRVAALEQQPPQLGLQLIRPRCAVRLHAHCLAQLHEVRVALVRV